MDLKPLVDYCKREETNRHPHMLDAGRIIVQPNGVAYAQCLRSTCRRSAILLGGRITGSATTAPCTAV